MAGMALTLLAAPCAAQDKLVAIVNDYAITQKDLNDFMSFTRIQYESEYAGQELDEKLRSMRKDLLDKLIEEKLVLKEAVRVGIKIDPAALKQRIEEVKRRYGSDGAFQASLAQQGLVQADVEARIREQMLIYQLVQEKVRAKITVKPTEVTEFYRAHPADFSVPRQGEFDAVSLSDEASAGALRRLIEEGRSFEEACKEKELQPNRITAAQDGRLKKEVEEAIFGLPLGGVSRPLRIENKYYLFKLNSYVPPRQRTLSEVQEEIASRLYEEKMQRQLQAFLDELKQNAYIKIL